MDGPLSARSCQPRQPPTPRTRGIRRLHSEMRFLGHCNEAQRHEFVKRLGSGGQIGHTHAMRSIPNSQIKAAIVFAIVKHGKFDKQGPGVGRKTPPSVAVEDAIIQSDETACLVSPGRIYPVAAPRHDVSLPRRRGHEAMQQE